VELVIFDCDGVLVDSEPITNAVFAEMLGELGLVMSLDDMYAHFKGHSMAQGIAIMERLLGAPAPADFVDAYRARSRAALAREVRPVRGIERALAGLDALGTLTCVASSGEHEKMQITLGKTGLLPRFEGRLFSVTEVARGKPHPDIFLHAAQCMGIAPSTTVVVEDSPVGVRAGAAAGMVVLGYADLTNPAELSAAGAACTFTDMHALPELVLDVSRGKWPAR
jgi:HAD superfamily hydrolase (TIGR01509 family)